MEAEGAAAEGAAAGRAAAEAEVGATMETGTRGGGAHKECFFNSVNSAPPGQVPDNSSRESKCVKFECPAEKTPEGFTNESHMKVDPRMATTDLVWP